MLISSDLVKRSDYADPLLTSGRFAQLKPVFGPEMTAESGLE
jgi:hypothetical protein